MLLIFKQSNAMRYHNRDSVVKVLGKIAKNDDIGDFPEPEAQVLLQDFPNNWFDYSAELEKQQAEAKRKQEELSRKFKSSTKKADDLTKEPAKRGRKPTVKEDK